MFFFFFLTTSVKVCRATLIGLSTLRYGTERGQIQKRIQVTNAYNLRFNTLTFLTEVYTAVVQLGLILREYHNRYVHSVGTLSFESSSQFVVYRRISIMNRIHGTYGII